MTRQEILMFVSIILLLIAIFTRWDYVKKKGTDAWTGRFKSPKEMLDSAEERDTVPKLKR